MLGLPATEFSNPRLIARFVVSTGPATDEILELHFVRGTVSAGPACDKIFVLQISRFVVLTGPAADEILEAPFCKAHGLCWACQ